MAPDAPRGPLGGRPGPAGPSEGVGRRRFGLAWVWQERTCWATVPRSYRDGQPRSLTASRRRPSVTVGDGTFEGTRVRCSAPRVLAPSEQPGCLRLPLENAADSRATRCRHRGCGAQLMCR